MDSNRRILFSAVGTSDPVRGGRDGSLLHITRYYKPSKVYLYYSDEMLRRDQEDNKCEVALKILDPSIEVEKIVGNLEPYDFDGFIKEFNRIINEIAEGNDGEILFNITSGTPQMKATLCLETVTSNKSIRAIQVLSPEEGANKNTPVFEQNMDVNDLMEYNLDNLEDSANRCIEPRIMSFRHSMLKSQIKSLIDIYDYEGAFRLVPGFGNPTLQKLVDHCRLRLNLEYKSALKTMKEYKGTNLFPVSELKIAKLVEYLLMLKVKQKKSQLTDMVIGLNPLLIEIMEEYVKEVLGTDVKDFYNVDKRKDEVRISTKKIDSIAPKFLEHLQTAFKGGFRDDSFVSIDFLHEAIIYFSDEGKYGDIELYNNLRKLNASLRNSSAHSLVAVSEEDVVKMSSMTSGKIIDGLEKQLRRIYKNRIPGEAFDAYDQINGFITEELNKY